MALAESHSIIVIEHDMEFVRQIARQVTVLHEGSVLFEGSMNEVQTNPRVIEVYLGSEPSISTEEMTILRIAASMAWSDGHFTNEQQDIILGRLSQQFAKDGQEQSTLQEELKDYLAKDIPVEDLVPLLTTPEEREMALKLSYEVLSSNQINQQKGVAYQRLLQALKLPPEVVQRVEQSVSAGMVS